jgi:TetR/AcrR family fatty acid metabolism transcriptional regulator
MALQQARSQQRQRRILDAAQRVFSRRAYRDASVDEIADEAKTSKGGVYFHFPNKESIFLALLDRTAARLRDKIETASAAVGEDDPVAKADAALLTVLRTFSKHRALARFFMVEALGAGREFHRRMAEVRGEFAALIQQHLDAAIERGMIASVDSRVASQAWFGALNEVITGWVLSDQPGRLEDSYDALRPLLMRSVGVPPSASPAGARRAAAGR